MIIGTGVDIVEVERMAAAYARFGLRFVKKILHPREMDRLPPSPAAYLASRFACKEAAAKALGTGFAYGVSPLQIEVAGQGRPMLKLHGAALERAMRLGAGRFHISLSHERHCAIAMVILEE